MDYALNEEEREVLQGNGSSPDRTTRYSAEDVMRTSIMPVEGAGIAQLGDYEIEDYDLEEVDDEIVQNVEVLGFGIEMMEEQIIRQMAAKAKRTARRAKAVYVKTVAEEMNGGKLI